MNEKSKAKLTTKRRFGNKPKRSAAQETWGKFLQHDTSRKILMDAWKKKNPQKSFSDRLRFLYTKYRKLSGPHRK